MSPNDERIEQVLTALRDAEPPTGMEERLQAGLRAADEATEPRTWMWLRRPAFTAGALAMAAIAILVGARSRQLHQAGHPQRTTAASLTPPQRGLRDLAVPEPPDSPLQESLPAPRKRLVKASPAVATELRQVRQVEAENIPAPPMPLTQQEILLVRLAHRNNAVQLGTLVADARELSFQHEKEQVREFFKPPLPAEDQPEANIPGGN
jgi:hypothetical protein